jgi:alanyl-tRNA synthetase
MNGTILLYDTDSHLCSFDAAVTDCRPREGGWAIALDRTAFCPEGGGQLSDIGMLNDARVTDVQRTPDGIFHYTDRPFDVGSMVHGELDWDRRFRHLQNHTGEHIVCGIAHNLFGMENVGFHLGPEDVTMDLDGELTRAQLQEIERRANEVVFANVPVWVTYPAPEELPGLTYRSKLELTEDVRLVHIGDVDVCACCVPHVMRTGEVGLIKILEAMRFRGGMRIHLKCGRDALADYNVKYRNIQQISALFSAKQHETAEVAEQFYQQYQHEKYIVAQLKKELAHAKAQNLPETAGNLCIFEDGEPDTLREIVNIGMTKCGKVCGVFSGSDAEGYKYILGSRTVNLRNEAKNFNRALNGRGGGRPEMIQGSVQAARAEIEAWFAAF